MIHWILTRKRPSEKQAYLFKKRLKLLQGNLSGFETEELDEKDVVLETESKEEHYNAHRKTLPSAKKSRIFRILTNEKLKYWRIKIKIW